MKRNVLASLLLAVAVAAAAYYCPPPLAYVEGCIRALVWPSSLVRLHVASDTAISIAYTWIPATLIAILAKRRDIPVNWIVLCFAAFIVLCGLTHVMGIITVWNPIYWLAGYIKAATGAVSVATAVLLHFTVRPILLALPTSADHDRALSSAKASAESEAKAQADLKEAYQALQAKATEAERANALLKAQAHDLVLAREAASYRAAEAEHAVERRTERVEELESLLGMVQRQREAIEMLSTPILDPDDGVLLLPLIGVLDSARASDAMTRLAERVSRDKARAVVIDLAGIHTVDTEVGGAILRMARVVQMLGATCLLSGVQPHVAQTIVGIGIDLGNVKTVSSVKHALAVARAGR